MPVNIEFYAIAVTELTRSNTIVYLLHIQILQIRSHDSVENLDTSDRECHTFDAIFDFKLPQNGFNTKKALKSTQNAQTRGRKWWRKKEGLRPGATPCQDLATTFCANVTRCYSRVFAKVWTCGRGSSMRHRSLVPTEVTYLLK